MKSAMNDLRRMLNPKTIALIGATEKNGTIGRTIMGNLLSLEGVDICPVSIARKSVLGIEAYPSVGMIPQHVDLAIIATPARTVPAIVEECGMSGVNGVVIVSGGFGEIGEEGKRLEGRIKDTGKKYQMRLLGPESAGFVRPLTGLNATFLRSVICPGNIGFLSQNAGLCAAIVDWAANSGIGFSMVASLGSMIDVDLADLIDFLADDYATKSVLIYMETVGDTRRFMSAARAIASRKPIIVLKPGRFSLGAEDIFSSLGPGGDDEIYDGAFRRAGILRVRDIAELFNSARILDSERLPRGPRVAIITNAGPLGLAAIDALKELGSELARLSDMSLQEMREFLPPHWRPTNPVNLLAFADIGRYTRSLETCLRDPAVDGVLVFHVPEGSTPSEELAREVARLAAKTTKPVIAAWMGGREAEPGRRIFVRHDIPVFKTPEDAAKTYALMYRRRRNLDHLYETPVELPLHLPSDKEALKGSIRRMRDEGRWVLNEKESKDLLASYGIPVATACVARDSDEAVSIGERIGYPVVVKVISPDIATKSEVGGVMLDVRSSDAIRQAWDILPRVLHDRVPLAKIEGLSVEPLIENIDYELTLAARKDRKFGTIVLLGLAGLASEFFREVSIALPPLNQTLAKMLIQETKAYTLLRGFRTKEPADFEQLEELIVNFSNLIVDFPEFAEIVVHPLAIAKGRPHALGVRMALDREYGEQPSGYPHLVIKPYPRQYITEWRTWDGLKVLLRPIKPEDEPLEQEMFASLDHETIRMRLLGPVKDIRSHDWLIRFCNIDYYRHIAIVAEIREGGEKRMIGVGRLAMTPDFDSAEFALLVHDRYQRKGLGDKLLRMLIDIGKEKGLGEISGEMLSENTKMVSLAMKLGFTPRSTGDGTTEVRLNLKG